MTAITTSDGTRICYEDRGNPDGMCQNHRDVINADLLAFLKS